MRLSKFNKSHHILRGFDFEDRVTIEGQKRRVPSQRPDHRFAPDMAHELANLGGQENQSRIDGNPAGQKLGKGRCQPHAQRLFRTGDGGAALAFQGFTPTVFRAA